MGVPGGGVAKRVVLEGTGWILVVVGLAALVLPGPGLIALFAGLVLLSQQYEWASRRLDPVQLRAMRGAADSVETVPRIIASTLAALGIAAVGVLWIVRPAAPSWWPVRESWWLIGGAWTGGTLIASGIFAIGLLIWSYRRFHGHPEARAALDDSIESTAAGADGHP